MYEVWTVDGKGERGVFLYADSTKAKCNRYIKQAVKKGADPNTLGIFKNERMKAMNV